MRRRPAPLLVLTAIALLAPLLAAGAAAGASRHRAPTRRSLPAIRGVMVQGQTVRAVPGRWRSAKHYRYRWLRCNGSGRRCRTIDGAHRRPRSGRTYKLTGADIGHRLRVTVRAANAWGHASATSRPSAVVGRLAPPATGGSGSGSGSGSGTGSGSGSGTSPSPAPAPSPAVNYFATVPSSEAGTPPSGIPRSDSLCASVVKTAAENRPQNTTANNTVPADPKAIDWGTALNGWPKFVYDRNLITGNYKGTTDEILQWVSCKWGIDANLVRADAVQESSWNQSTEGDTCNPPVAGDGSYGILQVRNKYCNNGGWVHGGYPYTANDTALDGDYWGARLRACFDGAFYNGGQWLYNGQTIGEVITAHGEDYAMWGCIGAWFDASSWYNANAQQYIAKVQNIYNTQPWTKPGF